jgi:hypothetical protein
MGMELPAELKWLEWVVGSDWPEGDEDALWRMKDAWHAAGHDVHSLLGDGNTAYYRVLSSVGGSLEEAFTGYWHQYSEGDEAYLTKLAQLCENLAQHCDDTALQIEYAKYQFIAALIILAIQIVYMLAMAAPSFGASTAGIPVAEVATQSFIRIVAQNIIRTMIFMIVQNVLSDVVVQAVQIGEGHRAHFDGSKTVQAAIDGAISGAVFGAAGGAVHVGGAKFAPNLSKTLLGKLGEGAAINVAGSLGLAAVTGQDLSFDNLAKTATAGVAMSMGGLGDHGTGRPAGHEGDPLTLDAPHTETDFLAGTHDSGTHTEPTAFDPGHPTPDDRSGPVTDPHDDGSLTRSASSSTVSGGDRIFSALTGEPDPAAHTTTDPVVHGTTDPVVHGTADPVVHGTADPVVHGTTDPVVHGASDPVVHGTTDPGSHVANDPAVHPAADDGTRLAGAQPTSLLDAPATTAPRPVDVPSDPTPRGTAASTGGVFAAPVPPHGVEVREAAPTAAGVRGDATTPTIPRPRTEPTGVGYEPPSHADHRPEPADAAPLPQHEDAFADRGVHPDEVAWSGEGRTLDPVQNAAADRFLAHAYEAESQITPRIRELAHEFGGELYGEDDARKSEGSFKRKLADEIAAYPTRSMDAHLEKMKDTVRYTVGFDDAHYTEGAQRVVDHLLGARDEHGQPRYEPVKFKNAWQNAEGYVGINSFWRDRATGQVFEVQIHTPESYRVTKETHGLYEVIRTTDDAALRAANIAETNARYAAEVPRPEGTAGIHGPDDIQPTDHPPQPGHEPAPPDHIDRGDDHESRPDGPGPYLPVTDAQAVDLVREHLHEVPSGYAFYPDGDHVLPFAEAVRPREGVVNLDLHGTGDGFLLDGRILTGEQFAHAIDAMRREGLIHIEPGDRIRLGSCDVGRGDDPPAQHFARASGLEVIAPTERLWTNMRGEEIVSSARLQDRRWVPGLPPDGHWRTFSPEHEIPGGHGTEPDATRGGLEPRGSDQHEPGRHEPSPHPEHVHDQDSPQWMDRAPDWDEVRDLLPADDSGYRITPDDCEFLGLDPRAIVDWATRQAPLGMSPEQFGHFRDTLFEQLRAEGYAPDQVDVRLQGSSANFFSGTHKTLPTPDQITDPEALRRYQEWREDATEPPLRRPFDSMYRLGLDGEPSDYDVQLSSDAMLAHAEAVRQERFPDLALVHRKYGFIDKDIAQEAFPELYAWAAQQSEELGRPVVPAVFPGSGPPDHSATSATSSHFRDTDWRIEP